MDAEFQIPQSGDIITHEMAKAELKPTYEYSTSWLKILLDIPICTCKDKLTDNIQYI